VLLTAGFSWYLRAARLAFGWQQNIATYVLLFLVFVYASCGFFYWHDGDGSAAPMQASETQCVSRVGQLSRLLYFFGKKNLIVVF
jgi:hypothetical protein